mmetsp:Transcript_19088/g.50630  ORF Transcript_19088/g.50630 Transcript_19088/m.50630 type:complete len:409 (+) Transcript_19088:46-1272(+)
MREIKLRIASSSTRTNAEEVQEATKAVELLIKNWAEQKRTLGNSDQLNEANKRKLMGRRTAAMNPKAPAAKPAELVMRPNDSALVVKTKTKSITAAKSLVEELGSGSFRKDANERTSAYELALKRSIHGTAGAGPSTWEPKRVTFSVDLCKYHYIESHKAQADLWPSRWNGGAADGDRSNLLLDRQIAAGAPDDPSEANNDEPMDMSPDAVAPTEADFREPTPAGSSEPAAPREPASATPREPTPAVLHELTPAVPPAPTPAVPREAASVASREAASAASREAAPAASREPASVAFRDTTVVGTLETTASEVRGSPTEAESAERAAKWRKLSSCQGADPASLLSQGKGNGAAPLGAEDATMDEAASPDVTEDDIRKFFEFFGPREGIPQERIEKMIEYVRDFSPRHER